MKLSLLQSVFLNLERLELSSTRNVTRGHLKNVKTSLPLPPRLAIPTLFPASPASNRLSPPRIITNAMKVCPPTSPSPHVPTNALLPSPTHPWPACVTTFHMLFFFTFYGASRLKKNNENPPEPLASWLSFCSSPMLPQLVSMFRTVFVVVVSNSVISHTTTQMEPCSCATVDDLTAVCCQTCPKQIASVLLWEPIGPQVCLVSSKVCTLAAIRLSALPTTPQITPQRV